MDPGAPTAELSRDELARLVEAVGATARFGVEDLEGVVAGILASAARATGSDRAALYLLGEGGAFMVLAGEWPEAGRVPEPLRAFRLEGELGEALMSSSAVVTHDAAALHGEAALLRQAGARHVMVLPLLARGQPTGVLHLVRERDEPYSAGEITLAVVLTEQATAHVVSARLLRESKRRLEETRLLLDIGRAVSASIDLDRILAVSIEALTRMLDATNAFVMLLDDQGKALYGVASSNPAHADFRKVVIPMTEPSIAVKAVKTRAPVMVDAAAKSRAVRRDLVRKFGEKSLLALPLVANDEALGAVIVDETRRERAWGRAEIERAELVAQQIAVAVANARLFDQATRSWKELSRAQGELVKRERLAALGQLAATMAHEVRNPLGVLFNSIGTLEKHVPQSGDAATLLAIMREELVRLNRLVRELLDFARPTEPSLEPESLDTLVESALAAAGKELGEGAASLTSELAAGLPLVRVDASMMRRALLNLILNGAQAAGSGGKVIVRASAEVRERRPWARVEVVDTGPGIPPSIETRIFEPFFTTKATGTGLGLAVVKSIAEGHGAEIEIASRAGQGTTMTMFIPVAERSERP